jgi:serine/threonine protein kinase
LRQVSGDRICVVLTNLTNANPRGQADEVDMVVVGPGGAVVIEVKHWDRSSLRSTWDVEAAAELITAKSKRIAGRLRVIEPKLGFVHAALLLTREARSLAKNGRLPDALNVRAYALDDLDRLLAAVAVGSIADVMIERLAKALAPRQLAIAQAKPGRLLRFVDLKLLTPVEDAFARVYSGRDTASGDRLIIYTYDLSAPAPGSKSELIARREFDAVQKLQKSPYLPSLVDSWQAVPSYAGELYFFTLADSAAPSVAQLAADSTWTVSDRLAFTIRALKALAELQQPSGPLGEVLVHRALTPASVRVRADSEPLFGGWRWARLPQAQTITHDPIGAQDIYAAPEVQDAGLAAASPAADVYSLCRVLAELFTGEDELVRAVLAVLALGLDPVGSKRAVPAEIAALLADGVPAAEPAIVVQPLSVARWDEGHVFSWKGDRFRVVSLLGHGGAGRTFKLEQLDAGSGDPIGTYVGKVVLNPQLGAASLDAYKRIRPIAYHPGLSPVLQTADSWSDDNLMALLHWRRGERLDDWRGESLEVLAELLSEANVEALLLRWAGDLCAALHVLHAQGWVHGDVSPANILVDEADVLLIDYDLAGRAGEISPSPGTIPYCTPERRAGAPSACSDDVFALAASLFHALTDRAPFGPGGAQLGSARLNWNDEERERWPQLVGFLDMATDADPSRRFETADAAGRALRARSAARQHDDALLRRDVVFSNGPAAEVEAATTLPTVLQLPLAVLDPPRLTPNVVPRVTDILSAYPGSRFGNAETRGLDTRFAHDTYVETRLDTVLPPAIRKGEVSLVILCGNAGDGKTAFLQHLASTLGAPHLPSNERVWEGRVDGLDLMINLDGAAAWRGRSANDLLDSLFAPFQQGSPISSRAHMVAVNDGRLMEWIENYEARHGETPLTTQLAEALNHDQISMAPHIRLIELNLRSLVGGLDTARGVITTEFLDSLVARMVGDEMAPEIWRPCRTCTAQLRCPMKRSADIMGASADPYDIAEGALFRVRLTSALQAVHQRNEVHITARELKAAVSYILFGLYSCEDLHADSALTLHTPSDHVFDPDSERRQGELLRELVRLDPALEAQARVDRYLGGRGAPDPAHGAVRHRDNEGAPLPLRSARRRAWFEWSDHQIEAVGGEPGALMLKDGRCFDQFRRFPLLAPDEQLKIKRELCDGLSRLEVLPDVAFSQRDIVPIRIVPRTPTETAFWVNKSLANFGLEAEQFNAPEGLETLHRHLTLTYRSDKHQRTERLTVSLELYALLINLANGVQILDAFSDDVFANLGVFTQRLAQEDERALRAWNPADEDRMYDIGIERREAGQTIVLTAMEAR